MDSHGNAKDGLRRQRKAKKGKESLRLERSIEKAKHY